ncbi:MAG: CoA transferase [Dehalococcoidia bacterium]|nr:CoA transferase [Dehalococcoidia bacterium]
MPETPSALDGITVVDLSTGLAGGLASMFLADNGARVVRIAFYDEDVVRMPGIFAVYDRGKEVLRLDPDASPEAVGELCADADIVLDDFAPGSSLRAQLGIDGLRSDNERLIHCSITAYGSDGPLKDEPADHDLVAARTGVLASQPSYRGGPIHVVHPIAYVGAGMLAALGICAAIYRREKTGIGSRVETSLMAGALLYTPKAVSDAIPTRNALPSPQGGGPFYSVFECADGEWLQIGCIHSGFVDLASVVIGVADVIAMNPEFGDGRWPATEDARRRLFDIVADRIRTRPSDEWIEELWAADVPCDLVRSAQEAMSDPQIIHDGLVQQLDDPVLGDTAMMGLPIKLAATPGQVRGPRVGGLQTRPYREHENRSQSRHSRESGNPGVEEGESSLPLSGVRIMEMTNVIAGPVAGRLLADLDAEMVKFESLDGDISRPAGGAGFISYNTNKISVSVNTRTDEGKEVARRLAATSDAILANMRPGATDRMGLDSETLNELNPGLIQSHVTAYGWDGPYSHRPGVDPIAQAITGLQHAQGGYDNPPVYLGVLAPCDYTGGALGALGTVLGLVARERLGTAQRVNTSLLAAGSLMCMDGFMRYEDMTPRPLPDSDQYGVSPLRRVYSASDGWIAVAADSPVTGLTWLSSSEQAERAIADMTVSEVLNTLRQHGVPCAPVVENYVNGFFDDPQTQSNRMATVLDHPSLGPVKMSGNLVAFDGSTTLPTRPTPLLGQHTREVLDELGYTPDQIDELYELGVVKTEAPA